MLLITTVVAETSVRHQFRLLLEWAVASEILLPPHHVSYFSVQGRQHTADGPYEPDERFLQTQPGGPDWRRHTVAILLTDF